MTNKDLKIKFPVKYVNLTQQIFDRDNQLVADVRGYGRLSHLDDPNAEQDKIGNFIASSMNAKHEVKLISTAKKIIRLNGICGCNCGECPIYDFDNKCCLVENIPGLERGEARQRRIILCERWIENNPNIVDKPKRLNLGNYDIGKTVINCKNREEAITFIKRFNGVLGYRFSLKAIDEYAKLGEELCLSFDGDYCDIDFYKSQGYVILNFEDFDWR